MTERWLSFQPVAPPLWLAVALIALGILLAFIEWKKPSRYPALRIFLVLIGILAITALLFRPQLRTEKSNSIILLTNNFDRKKTDSITEQYPKSYLYSLPNLKPYRESKTLQSIHELSALKNDIDFVIGNGLSNSAFDLISDQDFQYISSELPEGIVDLQIKNPIIINRENSILGSVNFLKENQKIILSGPGGKEDSLTIGKTGIQNFSLTFTPKQTGNFLYTLTVAGKSEQLPIQVIEHSASNILFLQQYPTFETRYLKQMLGKKHNLLFRYELSKNIFRFEKINNPGKEFQRISEDVLNTFDLLILDTDAFHQLSSNEIKAVKNSIKNGLGVILLFNELPGKNIRSFLPYQIAAFDGDTAQFNLSGKKRVLPAWPLEVGTESTAILGNKNRTLSGYANDGFGKVGFQLLQETYRISLEGDSLSYVTLWSDLLEKVVRTKQDAFKINVTNTFPIYADEPVTIEVIANAEAPEFYLDSVSVPMTEDPLIDGLWKTKIWFDKPGWQNLRVEGQSITTPVYVSADTAWQSLSSANNIRRTQSIASAAETNSKVIYSYSPVNPVIFYLIFLLCFGGLWLLPKV